MQQSAMQPIRTLGNNSQAEAALLLKTIKSVDCEALF